MTAVPKTKNSALPNSITALLNQLLANTIAFRMSAKEAHWNVRGKNFSALHGLFDQVSAEADAYADLLAERAGQLDAQAQGTLQFVSHHSSLPAYPASIVSGQDHLVALSGAMTLLADMHRQAVNTATDAGDMVTADILTEITRGFDKLLWLVKSHLNG